ncbi:MAG: alpha/beta hydrolase [Spongiibacteraceae bacterium]
MSGRHVSSLDPHSRIIIAGQKGTGSYQPVDYQWPQLASDMFGVADAMGASRFIAGGASMGCATAIYAALAAPERIDALILAIPPTAWETRAAQASVYDKMAQMVETDGLASLLQLFRLRPLFPQFLLQALPGLGEIGLRHMGALAPAMVSSLMRGAGASNLPAREMIATLSMPVLILAWPDDAVHPVSTATELARLLPCAELHIANTLDDVQAWPTLIRKFVDKLPAAGVQPRFTHPA